MIRYPRLLDSSLQEQCRLRPSRLQVTERLAPLSEAEMTLPEGEATVSPGMFAELYDACGSMGIFRVARCSRTLGTSGGQTVTLEHGLAALGDDVLPGYTELGGTGMTTSAVLQRLLACQTVQRWILGDCEYTEEVAYSWENENLLTALLSVASPLPGHPVWCFDQSVTPWRLHLRQASEEICECRMSRGLEKVTVTYDRQNLCTRLYPLGYGEGADQLTIAGVNGGSPYLQADTAGEEGIITRVWTDTSITEASTLLAAAQRELEASCRPQITVEVTGSELVSLTGESLDRLKVGRLCRIPLPGEKTAILQRIIIAHHPDVMNTPEQVRLTLATPGQDAASTLASLSRKASVGENYSQGAASEYSMLFGDNCDGDHPAVMRFFIDEDAIHVNSVQVRFSREAFRAYEKSTAAGGQIVASDDALAIGSAYMNAGKKVPVTDGYVTLTAAAIDHSHKGALRLAAHTHGMVYGIYEGERCDSVTVTVDGNPVAEGEAASGSFDALKYLKRDSRGRIQRGAWHEVKFTPSGMGRITANLHVRSFIRSITGAVL
ncbi:MAG: phage tail spike protein [Clostridia bacterium]|nr:phage tail spike protein [Clostridia bacterium]